MKKFLYYAIFYTFKILGVIHPVFTSLAINGETERLERNKQFEKAREIRKKYLKSLNKKYLAPLWRQEGFDLLYRIKDYRLSLKAFENAIDTHKLSSALYGVSNPLDIYFGASMASVSVDDKEKAIIYFSEFSKLYDSYRKNPKLTKALENYQEGAEWVSRYLEQQADI